MSYLKKNFLKLLLVILVLILSCPSIYAYSKRYSFRRVREASQNIHPPALHLREIRTLLDLTQKELAEKLGVSGKYVSKLENRDKPVTKKILGKAEEVYSELAPKKLKEIRETLGLTQKELGKLLGVSRQYINQMEKGRDPIPEQLLKRTREDIYPEIAPQRLKEIREVLGLTQERLGELLGVFQESISHMEKGRQSVPEELLKKTREDIYPEIAPQRLKEIREILGLTQEELGELLGVSRETINDMENGRRPVPEELLKKIREDIYPEIAPQKLKEIREALGLTQKELGELLGVSRQTIGDMEKGKRFVPEELLKKTREEIYPVLAPQILKEIRETLGLTQKELGKLLGVSGQYINDRENRRLTIPEELLKRTREEVYSELAPQRLKEIREALGLTQKELGELLGVSDSSICKLEKGKRSVPEQILKKANELLKDES